MISWWSNKKILVNFSKLTADDEKLLKNAWNRARRLHTGQKRKSGQPYFIHPIAVAEELVKKFADPILIAAALLHDTVEDCHDYLMGDIYREFGGQVGFLVDAVTKNRNNFYRDGQEFNDDTERFLWAGNRDIRCFLLKIADRQHNLDTIKHLSADKQIHMAFETQAILSPIKDIVGYDKSNTTVKKAAANWQRFLKQGKFKDLAEIKNNLYKRQFADLNCEMYDLICSHSDAIIWEMSDKTLFEKLLADQQFNKTADILLVVSDGYNFRAEFQFRQGYVSRNYNFHFSIAKFRI